VVRLGPLGRNSPAILLQASLLPLISETLSYPPSSLTRFHKRNRSIWRLPTLGSRSRIVLHPRQHTRKTDARTRLTRASRGTAPTCPGIPHAPGHGRQLDRVLCLAPSCGCRIYEGCVRKVSRDMHRVCGVPGAMADADVFVRARRAWSR
jgi:hypothetical protein